jgi:WD40 repeat protein
VYDTQSGRYLSTLALHRLPIESVAFSPDKMHVATASWGGTVKIWNVGGLTERVDSVAFSEDGEKVATATADSALCVWDAKTGVALANGSIPNVTSIALSNDGSHVATGNNDGALTFWERPEGNKGSGIWLEGHPARRHLSRVLGVEFSRDGNRLASVSPEEAFLWDVRKREVLHEMTSYHYYFCSQA